MFPFFPICGLPLPGDLVSSFSLGVASNSEMGCLNGEVRRDATVAEQGASCPAAKRKSF